MVWWWKREEKRREETCGGDDIGAEEIGKNVAEKGLQIVVVLVVGLPCYALSKFV